MTARDAAISMKEMISTAVRDIVPSNAARKREKASPSALKDRSITVLFPADSVRPRRKYPLLLKISSAVS